MPITEPTQTSNKPHAALLVVILALCACFFAEPATAFAKDYTMPSVDIQATVEPDGSLHVVEERTFSFDGSFSCVWWEFDSFEPGMEQKINGVQIKFPDAAIPEFEALKPVPFEKAWRSSGGPGYASYSVDEAYHGVYVFFTAYDTDMVVQLDYTVVNAAHLYEDCAELYWQYVGPDWAVSSRNVRCTIDLPANGDTGVPGDTVRAWGHGPLDGTVQFNDSGTQVVLEVMRVPSGDFAEARVTFPGEWLTDVDASYAREGAILPDLLAEEQREADAANRHRMFQAGASGLVGLAGLGGVIWAAFCFFRYGREHKPGFTEKYWRDVPNKQVHPVVIGRLMRWNRESSNDAATTILHLANLGAVSINRGSYEQPGFMGSARFVNDYYITLNRSVADRLVNPIDKELVKLLFIKIARNRPSMWLSEIAAWGDTYSKSYVNAMRSWQDTITDQVEKTGYFEEEGSRKQVAVITAAIVLFSAGLGVTVLLENLLPVAFALAASAIMVVAFGIFMPRRSQQGADDNARAKALRNWLNDFTLLDERLPTDVKVWGEFMVYAQVFGIAKKVAHELRGKIPELFAADASSDTGVGGRGLPWYTWYYTDRSLSGGGDTFAEAFDRTMSNTLSTARAAVAASEASSGSGGGGGFSGGGGGGFGGGGGGAR